MNDGYFYFMLSYLANLCQVDSYFMNKVELKNEDLMDYLQHQDEDYLIILMQQNSKIIEQNEKILELLYGMLGKQ